MLGGANNKTCVEGVTSKLINKGTGSMFLEVSPL